MKIYADLKHFDATYKRCEMAKITIKKSRKGKWKVLNSTCTLQQCCRSYCFTWYFDQSLVMPKPKMSFVTKACILLENRSLETDYISFWRFLLRYFLFLLEGKKHDASMLRDSGLLQALEQYAFSTTGKAMCIYGDPAYPLRVHLQGPFRDAHLTPQKQL